MQDLNRVRVHSIGTSAWILRGALSLLLALSGWACSEGDGSAEDCGGACSADQRCVDGKCISPQVGDMAVTALDAGPDQGQFIDTMPPPVMDASVPLDQAVEPDQAVAPDAAVIMDMAIPDMIVDAACVPSGEEICDELDNDCDGNTDEGELAPHGECETGFPGICAIGQYVCNEGVRSCESPLPLAADACDTLDNDCDGSTDEDGPTVGDPCETEGQGICRLGRFACDEVGDYVCAAQFEAVEETCDGSDNDCDGLADETDPQLGTDCNSGLDGICARGELLCAAGALICSPLTQPGTVAETCNNIDDNCNGVIDEDLPVDPQPCETDLLGACQTGRELCQAGQVFCTPVTPPRAELCNAVDDDCDGTLDEGFNDLLSPCSVGVGACERIGHLVCDQAALSTTCSAIEAEPRRERCDGLDNDCDGEIDNLVEPPQEPEHCGACGQVCEYPNAEGFCQDSECQMGNCRRGYWDVDGDPVNGCEWGCEPSNVGHERCADREGEGGPGLGGCELCDGVDNDCDGIIDGDDVCGGPEQDAFTFCRDRAAIGMLDRLCDDFSIGDLGDEYWAGSLIRAGDDVPSADHAYGAGSALETGGGHTRRIYRSGPGFRMGMHLTMRGPMAIGLYDSAVRGAGKVPLPQVLTTGGGRSYHLNQGQVINPPGQMAFRKNNFSAPGAMRLAVNGQPFVSGPFARLEDDGQTLVMGPVEVDPGIYATRRFHAQSVGDALRIVDIIENRTEQAYSVALQYDADINGGQGQSAFRMVASSDGDLVWEDADNWAVVESYFASVDIRGVGLLSSTPNVAYRPEVHYYGYRMLMNHGFEVPAGETRGVVQFFAMGPTDAVGPELARLAGQAAEVMGRCGEDPEADLRICREDVECPEIRGWCNDDPSTNRCSVDADCENEWPCVGYMPQQPCVGYAADPDGVPADAFEAIPAGIRPNLVNMEVPPAEAEAQVDPAPSYAAGAGYSLNLDRVDGVVHGRVLRTPGDVVLWEGPLARLGDQGRHWLQWSRSRNGRWRIDVDGRTMPPLRQVPDDLTHGIFDRLSFWIGPDPAGPSIIDDIALQFDPDGDDVYPPQDNCPYTPNPEQADADQNGRGAACDDRDGDGVEDSLDLCVLAFNPEQRDADLNGRADACDYEGSLMIAQSRGTTLAPWAVDLRNGAQMPLADFPTGSSSFRRHPDGRFVWTQVGNIQVFDAEGEPTFLTPNGIEPQWWGDEVVFLNADRQRAYAIDPAGGQRVEIARAEAGRLRVAPSADRLLVLDMGAELGRVWTIDRAGAVQDAPIDVPGAGEMALPWVVKHPRHGVYYVSATTGPATGLKLLNADNGQLTPHHARPVAQLALAPNGGTLFTSEVSPEGTRIMAYALDEAGAFLDEGRAIMGPDPLLNPTELGWIMADVQPPAADTDGDGLSDESDPCVDYGDPVLLVERPLNFEGYSPRLNYQVDGLVLQYLDSDQDGNGRSRHMMSRISQTGDILTRLSLGQLMSTTREYVYRSPRKGDPGLLQHARRPVAGGTSRLTWFRGQYHFRDIRQAWPRVVGAEGLALEGIHRTISADLEPGRIFVSNERNEWGSKTHWAPFPLGENLVSLHSLTSNGNGWDNNDSYTRDVGHALIFGPGGEVIEELPVPLPEIAVGKGQIYVHNGRPHLHAYDTGTGVWPFRDDMTLGPQGAVQNGRGDIQRNVSVAVGPNWVWAMDGVLRTVRPGDADTPARDLTIEPVFATEGTLIEPQSERLVYNGDKLLLLWVGRTLNDATNGVYIRTFDERLNPLQAPTRITSAVSDVVSADIVWDGQRYVMVWTDTRDQGEPKFYFGAGRFDCK